MLGTLHKVWLAEGLIQSTEDNQNAIVIIIIIILVFYFFVFRDRVSLYSPGCPGTLCRPGWPRTQKSTCLCLCLPIARIKDVCRHARCYCDYY